MEKVCPGDSLALNCSTNGTLLTWSIRFTFRSGTERRFFGTSGTADSQAPLIVNQTVFQFLRSSISPLSSTMIVDNVVVSLNETVVECSYEGITSETTIYVIESGIIIILIFWLELS